LLDAGDVECAKSLVFVLSEPGLRSIEVMGWLDALLDFPDDFVQHYAVVAVQHSGSLEHGRIVAKAVSRLGGARAVSLAALKFVALGSLRQVATAEDFLDDDLREAVVWLTGERYEGWERFFAGDGAVALVAVAAAYRLREVDPAPLAAAAEDPCDEVADAARFIARFQPLPAEGQDILHRIARRDVVSSRRGTQFSSCRQSDRTRPKTYNRRRRIFSLVAV
jgi:hypothetical protein